MGADSELVERAEGHGGDVQRPLRGDTDQADIPQRMGKGPALPRCRGWLLRAAHRRQAALHYRAGRPHADGEVSKLSELLEKLLDKHASSAEDIFDQLQRGFITPALSDRLREITAPITSEMMTIDEFRPREIQYFAGHPLMLHPAGQARNLLKMARVAGGKQAVEWYRHVLATEKADVNVFAEIQGIGLEGENIEFPNGVKLIHAQHLSNSFSARQIKERQNNIYAATRSIAAIVEIHNAKATAHHPKSYKIFQDAFSKIMRTVTAFSISPNLHPTVGIAWSEFANPDLAAADISWTWQTPLHDGQPASFPVPLDADTLDWVKKVLALKGSVAKSCDLALSRLNLGRRRHGPGDKAIEGSICLEALLGGGELGDLGYKLRLRTALFLADELAEREKIATAIKEFYRLRGKFVHGEVGQPKQEDHRTAADGLSLCLQVIRAVVNAGLTPDPKSIELSGGKVKFKHHTA